MQYVPMEKKYSRNALKRLTPRKTPIIGSAPARSCASQVAGEMRRRAVSKPARLAATVSEKKRKREMLCWVGLGGRNDFQPWQRTE